MPSPYYVLQTLQKHYSKYTISNTTGLNKLLSDMLMALTIEVDHIETTPSKASYMALWKKPILYLSNYENCNILIDPETSYILHECVHVTNTHNKRHQGFWGKRTDETQAELITRMIDICYNTCLLEGTLASEMANSNRINTLWVSTIAQTKILAGTKIQGVWRKTATIKDLELIAQEFDFKIDLTKLHRTLSASYPHNAKYLINPSI